MCLVYLDEAKIHTAKQWTHFYSRSEKKSQTYYLLNPLPRHKLSNVKGKKNMGSYYLCETDQMCLTKVFIILFTGFRTVTIKC